MDTRDPPADDVVAGTDANATSPLDLAVARKSYRCVVPLPLGTSPANAIRRKYRKIMVNFERRMQESNNLFRDEQKINDISQRLAEQTE
jgi:hypothetical protein